MQASSGAGTATAPPGRPARSSTRRCCGAWRSSRWCRAGPWPAGSAASIAAAPGPPPPTSPTTARTLPGDDFRRIDWNAYGRFGTLYVKLTEAREQLPVHILLDASRSMAWGEPAKLQYASQIAAALGYVALARYDRLTVTALGEEPRQLPSVRGRGRFGHLLNFLSDVQPSGAVDLAASLAAYRVDRRAGGLAILISDLLSPDGYEDGLDKLLQAGLDVIVLQVLSPQELDPAEGGDVELVDAETGEIVEVSLTPRMIGIYRERLDRWCAEAEEICARRGIAYCRVSTDTPLEELLLDQLRRVGILR